ncbi:ABC transporter E family member 2 [Glycine max]|nr:ABC transporter E family member 2 [Glycine max]
MADRLTRIAIVSNVRCKPKKFRQECKKSCPVVTTERLCIEVTSVSKIAFISEELCTGCGICVKIINLPKDLDRDTTHRYGPDTFKLHRLPVPRPGQVLGLVGTNGIGKSTALKVLAGKLKPNLGRFTNPPDWQEILTYFRGSELQNYFTRILEDDLKILNSELLLPKSLRGLFFMQRKRLLSLSMISSWQHILQTELLFMRVNHQLTVLQILQSLLTGMNVFLSHLDITFRRDPTNFRPRINKLDSTKDREQKSAGSFTNTTLHLFELFLGFQIWFTVHALKYKIAIFNVEGIFLNGD